jgi:hypothetical protein
VDHPYPWLKYLPADELKHLDLDKSGNPKGWKVEDQLGEKMGTVEGFIVDSESGRPYYVVVDAGGWFKSKHYLLPIGLLRPASQEQRFGVDRLARERVKRFPGFDLGKFDKMTVDDLKRLTQETLEACTVAGVVFTYEESDPLGTAWDRPEFAYPDWWRTDRSGVGQTAASRASASTPASSRTIDPDSWSPDTGRTEREPERVVARGETGAGQRAQPGDVLGVEEGGERTYVGDTAEDEDRRRERAEKAAERKR